MVVLYLNGLCSPDFVSSYLRDLKLPTWIGLTDSLVEGGFGWSDGVSPVLYTNWADKEPNNNGGRVRIMHSSNILQMRVFLKVTMNVKDSKVFPLIDWIGLKRDNKLQVSQRLDFDLFPPPRSTAPPLPITTWWVDAGMMTCALRSIAGSAPWRNVSADNFFFKQTFFYFFLHTTHSL